MEKKKENSSVTVWWNGYFLILCYDKTPFVHVVYCSELYTPQFSSTSGLWRGSTRFFLCNWCTFLTSCVVRARRAWPDWSLLPMTAAPVLSVTQECLFPLNRPIWNSSTSTCLGNWQRQSRTLVLWTGSSSKYLVTPDNWITRALVVFQNSRNCLPSIHHSLSLRPPPPFLRRYSEDLNDTGGMRDELFHANLTVPRNTEFGTWDIRMQERGALPLLGTLWNATLFCLKITRIGTVVFLRRPACKTWGPFKGLLVMTVWLKLQPCCFCFCATSTCSICSKPLEAQKHPGYVQ